MVVGVNMEAVVKPDQPLLRETLVEIRINPAKGVNSLMLTLDKN